MLNDPQLSVVASTPFSARKVARWLPWLEISLALSRPSPAKKLPSSPVPCHQSEDLPLGRVRLVVDESFTELAVTTAVPSPATRSPCWTLDSLLEASPSVL